MIFDNKGVLGINARNLLYIKPYNPKKAIKLADDKLKTKQFLAAREINVPKLFNVIKNQEELENFNFNSLPNAFVIKPNHGYGGEGIIPIVNKKDNYWITAGEEKLSKQDLKEHISDILDGRFSLSNISDYAFFEQLIVTDPLIEQFTYKGLPDIRVVVHNLIPVMAMLRIPTKESKGKANLHLGAVGVGIDIAKGRASYISYKNKIIDEIPGGKGRIMGFKIPHWDEILLMASKIQLISNLGYLAVDICLDKNSGPIVLEINARAGLGVQIADLAPLRKRLERIEGVKVTSPTKGVRIAKDMFGNTFEKEIKNLSGKQVIGTKENVELIIKNGTLKVKSRIDTKNSRTIIDEKTAKKAKLLDNIENYDEAKSTLKIKFTLKGKRIQTIADIEPIMNEKYQLYIGTRDLSEFLIDTNLNEESDKIKGSINIKKAQEKKAEKTPQKINYTEIDQTLVNIDKKVKFLYHLRPINLKEEKEKFLNNEKSNPQFEYPKLKFDPIELIHKLNKIKLDNSVLGKLFNEKKEEILQKIKLIESIGEKEEFTKNSIKLYGQPNKEDYETCKKYLKNIDFANIKKQEAIYNAEDAKIEFEKVLKKYNLDNWKVKIKEEMVTRCVANKNNVLLLKKDAKFTRDQIKELIIHEIETHILTAENGKKQAYKLLSRGLANYLETQEGLAVYNAEKNMFLKIEEKYNTLRHVIAIYEAMTKSFREIFDSLRQVGLSKSAAFGAAVKAKRGLYDSSQTGAFTKDHIYFSGYNSIKKFVNEGGDIKDLYIGKLNIKDLDLVKKIPGIIEASILPSWLKSK